MKLFLPVHPCPKVRKIALQSFNLVILQVAGACISVCLLFLFSLRFNWWASYLMCKARVNQRKTKTGEGWSTPENIEQLRSFISHFQMWQIFPCNSECCNRTCSLTFFFLNRNINVIFQTGSWSLVFDQRLNPLYND